MEQAERGDYDGEDVKRYNDGLQGTTVSVTNLILGRIGRRCTLKLRQSDGLDHVFTSGERE